jgi:hypothetical protein
MVIIFQPLPDMRHPGFRHGNLFRSSSGKAYSEVPKAMPFSLGAVAVGFPAAQSSFDKRSPDDFAQGRELSEDLFAAKEEGSFGVHI